MTTPFKSGSPGCPCCTGTTTGGSGCPCSLDGCACWVPAKIYTHVFRLPPGENYGFNATLAFCTTPSDVTAYTAETSGWFSDHFTSTPAGSDTFRYHLRCDTGQYVLEALKTSSSGTVVVATYDLRAVGNDCSPFVLDNPVGATGTSQVVQIDGGGTTGTTLAVAVCPVPKVDYCVNVNCKNRYGLGDPIAGATVVIKDHATGTTLCSVTSDAAGKACCHAGWVAAVDVSVTNPGYFDASNDNQPTAPCGGVTVNVTIEDKTFQTVVEPQACWCCRENGFWANRCDLVLSHDGVSQSGSCDSNHRVTFTWNKDHPNQCVGPWTLEISDSNRCRSTGTFTWGRWAGCADVGYCNAVLRGDQVAALTTSRCYCGCNNCREPYPRELHYSDALGTCVLTYTVDVNAGIFGWLGEYVYPHAHHRRPYSSPPCCDGGDGDATVIIYAACTFPTWTVQLTTKICTGCDEGPYGPYIHIAEDAMFTGQATFTGYGSFTSSGVVVGIADCDDPVNVTGAYPTYCRGGTTFCVAEVDGLVWTITE